MSPPSTAPAAVVHLLVDARPLDHPTAGNRGIGRWVRGFLQGLADIGAPFTALHRTDEQERILRDEVPDAPRLHWDRVTEHPAVQRSGTWYVATQLLLHPVSLDPIPSVITGVGLPVAGVMYDVIPYRYPERYLIDPDASALARVRAPLVRTTDALVAISEFAAHTASETLLYPRERIAVIGSGVTTNFSPPSPMALELPERLGLTADEAYVVAVTGADERKNSEGLIAAWGLMPTEVRAAHRLVLATGVPDQVAARWRSAAAAAGVSDGVLITGGLEDHEMVAVLQRARLSVMPSFDEGFGLPVVEAAACRCPVICSDVSSLPEVLDEPAATFPPDDPAAMARAIERALTDEVHRAVLARAAARAAERWTWPNAARRALSALTELGPRWAVPPGLTDANGPHR